MNVNICCILCTYYSLANLNWMSAVYITTGRVGLALPTPITFDMSQQPQLTDSTSNGDENHDSLIRRSWHAMSDLFQPFSRSALDKLPKAQRPRRYTRADEIPDVEETDDDGQMPTVRDYHSITVPPQVRVPKKIPTPVRVESKVWFANERSTYPFPPTYLLSSSFSP